MHDPEPERHVLQSVAAVPEVLEITIVGTPGATTVPSVPVPLIAKVLGRRTWRTEPPLALVRLSMKATFWPLMERTGDVVTAPPVPVWVS